MKEPFVIPRQYTHDVGFSFRKLTKYAYADYPLHWHEFYELEYILSGKGHMIINGKQHEIKPGMLCFMTPMDFQQANLTETMELINVSFTENWILHDILDKIQVGAVIYDLPLTFIKELENEYSNKSPFKDLYVKQILNCIMIRVLRENSSVSQQSSATPIQKVLQYMQMHFKEELTVSMLANYVNLTPNYLSSAFHRTVGKTLNEYITELRLDFSKKLLTLTDLPITQICYECGFGSFSNFMRLFKKRYNMSPGQLRKSKKDEHHLEMPLDFDNTSGWLDTNTINSD